MGTLCFLSCNVWPVHVLLLRFTFGQTCMEKRLQHHFSDIICLCPHLSENTAARAQEAPASVVHEKCDSRFSQSQSDRYLNLVVSKSREST